MNLTRMKTVICILLSLSVYQFASAETTLPAIFGDHMVLQRGDSTPVWGWAPAGQEITIEFAGQTAMATADSEGRWKTELTNLTANAAGAKLVVRGDETIEFSNVVVGDVWLASGQSNMAMTVGKSEGREEAIASSADNNLRVITVQPAGISPLKPLTEHKGEWRVAGPETVGNVTAAGYYFARRLRDETGDLPIGLIQSSWGGTMAEQWTSREALEANPVTKPIWDEFQRRVDEFDPATATPPEVAQQLLKEWQALNKEARRKKERIPPRPNIVGSPTKKRYTPSNQFNTMIDPIVPYSLRGFFWYQGESNRVRAEQYEILLPVMIADWRTRWERPEAPFYIVQLANTGKGAEEPVDSEWAELQWAQFRVARATSNSGLAVINDGSDATLHPREKRKVGERLALWALARDYDKPDFAHSGPLYRESQVEGMSIRIFFDHAEGLRSSDGKPLQRFQIARADRKWVWADAAIDGETVVVSNPKVETPVAVRYAWNGNPAGANLTNASGLPASLFKTDDWPGLSHGKLISE
jgi:sialate O-acetylesterase